MFKVIDKLRVGSIYCVSIEGDVQCIRNGVVLYDERGNVFEVETVALSHYKNIEDFKKYAEVVFKGDVEKMGQTLFLEK